MMDREQALQRVLDEAPEGTERVRSYMDPSITIHMMRKHDTVWTYGNSRWNQHPDQNVAQSIWERSTPLEAIREIAEATAPLAPLLPDTPVRAHDVLQRGIDHMRDRATTYDSPQGERSMGKTVKAFNVITGRDLTEEEGWLFMELLKQVRSVQGDFKLDNYEDLAAYAGLRAEAAHNERGNK